MRPVFQPKILLTRLSLAQAFFSSTGWSLCFWSTVPGSFRSFFWYSLLDLGEVLQQHCCCQCVSAEEQQVTHSKRCMPWFRKEQFSAPEDDHICYLETLRELETFWLFLCLFAPLCPNLHIRGFLDFFTLRAFKGFEGLWASLGSPFLLKWERKWRGLLLTSASRGSDFAVWFQATEIYLALKGARPLGDMDIVGGRCADENGGRKECI